MNINGSEKWGKIIQAVAYDGARMVVYFESLTLYLYLTKKNQVFWLRMHLQQMELNFPDGYI